MNTRKLTSQTYGWNRLIRQSISQIPVAIGRARLCSIIACPLQVHNKQNISSLTQHPSSAWKMSKQVEMQQTKIGQNCKEKRIKVPTFKTQVSKSPKLESPTYLQALLCGSSLDAFRFPPAAVGAEKLAGVPQFPPKAPFACQCHLPSASKVAPWMALVQLNLTHKHQG